MATTFDVIVIGSGSAGFAAAEAARAAGASVCLVEKAALGGECPNWACVPSKALLRAARAAREAKAAPSYGVSSGGLHVDWPKVMEYRKRVVDSITGGDGARYVKLASRLGVEIVRGAAAFLDANTVDVGGKLLRARAFVVATGTVDFIPPNVGLEGFPYVTSRDALRLERLPKTMAIIGGGPVGCEIATAYASFGTRVVLIQSAATVLNREDAEIGGLAGQALSDLGVEVETGANVLEVINARGGVYGLKVSANGSATTHAVDCVVVAAGRRANVAGLGLDLAGVKLDAQGNVATGDDQRTSARHVFAAGDADGGFQFTHVAHHEGAVAGHNAALEAKGKRVGFAKSDEHVVPRVTFVSPEVASVGMTADEAKTRFKKALVGRYAVASLGRATTDHAQFGLVKVVAHPTTRKVLGCHILSEHAGETVHEAALAIHLGATVDKIASMIHAYPSWSEGLVAAAASCAIE